MKTFKIVSVIVFLILIGDYFFPLFSLFKFNPDIAASREKAAIQALKILRNAQTQFKACRGRFGTLQELANMGFIDAHYASGNPVARFVYSSENITAQTYCIKANRWKDKAGPHDFNVIEDGKIRFEKSETLGSAVCRKGSLLIEPKPTD